MKKTNAILRTCEVTINSIDNGSYVNLSNFVTTTNSHKYFSDFLISGQLKNRATKFGLLSLTLPLL